MPPNQVIESLVIDTGPENQFIMDNSSSIHGSSDPIRLTSLTAAMLQYKEAHPDRQQNLNFAVLKALCSATCGISKELFTALLEDQFINAYDHNGNCLLFITVVAFSASWTLLKETEIVEKHFFVLSELIRRGANIRIADRNDRLENRKLGTTPAQFLIRRISNSYRIHHSNAFELYDDSNELPNDNDAEKINKVIDRILDTLTRGYSSSELQALIAPLTQENLLKVPSILKRIQVGEAVIALLFSTSPVPSTNPANKVQGLIKNDGDNSGMRRVMSFLF